MEAASPRRYRDGTEQGQQAVPLMRPEGPGCRVLAGRDGWDSILRGLYILADPLLTRLLWRWGSSRKTLERRVLAFVSRRESAVLPVLVSFGSGSTPSSPHAMEAVWRRAIHEVNLCLSRKGRMT
jgi:hypothetical protein